MHYARISPNTIFFAQNARHIVIRITGMDDQGQAGLARRCNMDAQGSLLFGGTFGGVVVIKPGLTDADKL